MIKEVGKTLMVEEIVNGLFEKKSKKRTLLWYTYLEKNWEMLDQK